jgi:hypothetical protein
LTSESTYPRLDSNALNRLAIGPKPADQLARKTGPKLAGHRLNGTRHLAPTESAHPITRRDHLPTHSHTAAGVIDLPGGWRDLVLRLAASAYLGRFTGISRAHTESDLRLFFTWCVDQRLRPLEVQRAQVERYLRWMQEVRRFKLSTVSRRMAVVAGFYRTCVIDAVLEHSPADYVRRPPVPA